MWSLVRKIITCCAVFLSAGRAGHALKTIRDLDFAERKVPGRAVTMETSVRANAGSLRKRRLFVLLFT